MLKRETVIREFKKRGWLWCDESGGYLLYQYFGSRIFGKFDGYMLRLHDARVQYHSNFHLDSYWNFTNMKQLREGLGTIEKVYSEICGIRFNEEVK